MNYHICKTCGGTLINENNVWLCKYCGNTYEDQNVKKEEEMLHHLLDEMKRETVANLRRSLYDVLNSKYIDSDQICNICMRIKEILPEDFMARFYYTANRGTTKDICVAIRDIDEKVNSVYIDGIVSYIIKSMRSEYALPLQNLIERAYKNTDMHKFEVLSTAISDEMVKVNSGMYETSVPRDVFVVYSSKDMKQVEELVEYLEDNSLDCFVAARNLRHGRGAVQNYDAAIREAMDNCKWIVFVSSVNSRNMECDALKVELKYAKNHDIQNSPLEYRQNYLSIPDKYKKKRIEYRLDNESSQPIAEKILKEFFSGLEYALSPEEVVNRIYEIDDASVVAPIVAKKENPINTIHPIRAIPQKNNRLRVLTVLCVVVALSIGIIGILISSLTEKADITDASEVITPDVSEENSVTSNNQTIIKSIGIRTITFSDKFTADFVLASWESGSASESSIIALMDEYGAEEGGGKLYVITPGEFIEEIENWCFSSERKVGDCAIIENDYGFSLCYISSINYKEENTYFSSSIQTVKSGVLQVAVCADYEPYEYIENGEFKGIEIDIMKAIATELGLTIEFEDYEFSDMYNSLIQSEVDCIIGMQETEERNKSAEPSIGMFSEPDWEYIVYTKKGSGGLSSAINAAISKLKNNGTISRIIDNYK
ncbi:MAG: transporter substrate-binding domain-containing protein [Ruminococcaceae bacterium]|nr:transporter substrate-binding domain-containing protein [Oscillospiraceae bacterium]